MSNGLLKYINASPAPVFPSFGNECCYTFPDSSPRLWYTVSSAYLHHERLIMLHRKRLELALEKMTASDWPRFEEFASAFLTSEFPNLRTVASPSGDDGRDAELFSPEGESSVVLQYSVTSKWEAKIRDTARKVNKNLSAAKQLLVIRAFRNQCILGDTYGYWGSNSI